MNKVEMVKYLAAKYDVSHEVAEDACRANDWDLMMSSGELRDQA